MAHHSGPDEKDMSDELRALFTPQSDTTDRLREFTESLGATRNFPQGMLGDDDEGELRIGATVADGKVVLAFGKHVDWIGFAADQARDIAQLLLDKAQECDGVEARVRKLT